MGKTFGIDISKWQGNFNFAKAAAEGVKFAILKAGGSDAGRYKDKKFDSYYNECIKLGIPTGAYYFGKDMTVESAMASAEHFVKLLRGKQYYLPVFYDVEGAMLNINKKLLTDIIIAFCSKVASYGYKVGIYTSQSVFNNKVYDKQLLKYSHWVARWSKTEPKNLNSGANIDVWQFGGETNYIKTNKVAGVTCDQDFCYIDYALNVESGSKPITTQNIPKPNTPAKEINNTDYNYNGVDLSYVFNGKYYSEKYMDLRNAFGTNETLLFDHFCKCGMKEARQASSTFNPINYRQNYPDLEAAFGDNWIKYYAHFCTFGIKEGRKGL